MSTLTMNWTQQCTPPCEPRCAARKPAASPLWQLAPKQPRRLAAARAARWLRLREGEAWITADGRRGAPAPEDWWLVAGQTLRLPAGMSVVVEGWPGASFELLEEPPA